MKHFRVLLILFVCSFVLVGCDSIVVNKDVDEISDNQHSMLEGSGTNSTATLIPTTSPTDSPSPTSTMTLTPTHMPSPTPTPFLRDGSPISGSNFQELQQFATLGKGSVNKVDLSMDGKVYVINSGLGIYLYDSESLAQTAFFEEFGAFYLIPRKSEMVAVTPDLTLAVIDLHSATILHEMKPPEAFAVMWIVFSPDVSRMAVAMTHPHATRQNFTSYRIDIWDLEQYSLVSQLESDIMGICVGMAFSPNNQQLISENYPPGWGPPKLAHWDISEGALTWYLSDEGRFTSQPFSQDGSLIAFHLSNNSRASIRRTSDGAEIGRVTGAVGVNSFSPDNTHIVTSSHQEIFIWNILSSQRIKRLQTDMNWSAASFSDDGEHILANYGQKAWRRSDFSVDEDYPKPESNDFSMRPLSDWRAQGHVNEIMGFELIDEQHMFVWGVTNDELNWLENILWWWYPEMEIYEEVSLGIDAGLPALSPTKDAFAVCTLDGLWMIQIQAKSIETMGSCRSSSSAVEFSKDGSKLFIASGILIEEFDLENQVVIGQLRGHSFNVGNLKRSQDGKYLFSTNAEEVKGGRESIIWTLNPNSSIRTWNITSGSRSDLSDAIFSFDGSVLITVFGNKTSVWRIKDGWYLAYFDGTAVALSSEEDLAVVGISARTFHFYATSNWENLGIYGDDPYDQSQTMDAFFIYTEPTQTKLLKFLKDGRVLVSITSDDVVEFFHVP